MNRKQIISMWCGILAVGWVCFRKIPSSGIFYYDGDWDGFFLWIILIGLVTGGLILTFKDEKRPEGKAKKPMNLRRGFKRITLILSLLSASVLLIAGIVNASAGEWDDMLLSLAGSLAAFAGVWILYGIIRWVTIPIIRWVITGFRVDTG